MEPNVVERIVDKFSGERVSFMPVHLDIADTSDEAICNIPAKECDEYFIDYGPLSWLEEDKYV